MTSVTSWFGLVLPEDLLPSCGHHLLVATKSMVRALTPETSFTAEQVATRDAIGASQAPHGDSASAGHPLLLPPLLAIASRQPPMVDLGYQSLFEVSNNTLLRLPLPQTQKSGCQFRRDFVDSLILCRNCCPANSIESSAGIITHTISIQDQEILQNCSVNC